MFTGFLITMILFLMSGYSIENKDKINALYQMAAAIPKHSNLINGHWSLYVLDTETGNTIIDINGQKSLAPASNIKLITSAVALDLLGEDKQFKTQLAYTGNISDDGVLAGDLILRGEGDPTLGSPEYQDISAMDSLLNQWVHAVREQGITEISGNIIGDDSYLDYMPVPPEYYWRDMGNYYAAGTSALAINENLYTLYFKPGKRVGQPAKVIRTVPEIPGLTFINHMKTGPVGSGDKGFIYGAPWQYEHQLEGTIPAGVKEFSIKGALPDPAKFCIQIFHEKLAQAGIQITGKTITVRESQQPTATRTVFYSYLSPPLKDIIYRFNKRSVNFYGEQLIRIIGKEVKGEGSLQMGIETEEEWLDNKGIYIQGLFLHDGSGLSRANAVSTRSFAELLDVITAEKFFKALDNSLSIAGNPDDIGNMKNMCRGTLAAKNLRAKTGSITRMRAHSGYVNTRSGKLLSFSMIANEYTGKRRTIDRLHEKVMVLLAELP
jgi:D-alanyl-D-alanine carboxypeptidase/D-alanyl-D-alanine-endopeptidase (penicillin-binding protein 4)